MSIYYIPVSQKTYLNTHGKIEYNMFVVIILGGGTFALGDDIVHVRIMDFANSYLGHKRNRYKISP